MPSLPRYLPSRPFPPYTYVPGRAPHPIRDPAGHMHGQDPEKPKLIVEEWWNCPMYLWGIDLFNHGYYWEAHEAWESLWHAAGRTGPVADFLKGLIKLAAAGVKMREGSTDGCRRHLERAKELFESVLDPLGETVMGLAVDAMASVESKSEPDSGDSQECVPMSVFSFSMHPCRIDGALSHLTEESHDNPD